MKMREWNERPLSVLQIRRRCAVAGPRVAPSVTRW